MTFLKELLELCPDGECTKALKLFLKVQIKSLCQQLSSVGEDLMLITANAADGTHSCIGSDRGEKFLDEHMELEWQFLTFCCGTVDVNGSRQENRSSNSQDGLFISDTLPQSADRNMETMQESYSMPINDCYKAQRKKTSSLRKNKYCVDQGLAIGKHLLTQGFKDKKLIFGSKYSKSKQFGSMVAARKGRSQQIHGMEEQNDKSTSVRSTNLVLQASPRQQLDLSADTVAMESEVLTNNCTAHDMSESSSQCAQGRTNSLPVSNRDLCGPENVKRNEVQGFSQPILQNVKQEPVFIAEEGDTSERALTFGHHDNNQKEPVVFSFSLGKPGNSETVKVVPASEQDVCIDVSESYGGIASLRANELSATQEIKTFTRKSNRVQAKTPDTANENSSMSCFTNHANNRDNVLSVSLENAGWHVSMANPVENKTKNAFTDLTQEDNDTMCLEELHFSDAWNVQGRSINDNDMFESQDPLFDPSLTLSGNSRLFVCGVCGQHFSERKTLTRHEMIHTGEKPFRCDSCPKSFSRKDYLMKHSRQHTGIYPFSCKTCRTCFHDHLSYRKHLLTASHISRTKQEDNEVEMSDEIM